MSQTVHIDNALCDTPNSIGGGHLDFNLTHRYDMSAMTIFTDTELFKKCSIDIQSFLKYLIKDQ